MTDPTGWKKFGICVLVNIVCLLIGVYGNIQWLGTISFISLGFLICMGMLAFFFMFVTGLCAMDHFNATHDGFKPKDQDI